MKPIKLALLGGAAIFFTMQFSPRAYGAEWFVAASGSDSNVGRTADSAFASIQKAIDVSVSGDTIAVADGVYEPIVAGRKSILIRSVNGASNTVIDASLTWSKGVTNRCATFAESSETVLRGFRLINGIADSKFTTGASIDDCGGGTLYGTLEDCIIEGNRAARRGGGSCYGLLTRCLIAGNVANDSGGGSTHSTLQCCVVKGNVAANDGGGAVAGTIDNCIVVENHAGRDGGGVYFAAENSGTTDSWGAMRNCTVTMNHAGRNAGGVHRGTTVANCIILGNHAAFNGNVYGARCCHTCSDPIVIGDGNICESVSFVNPLNGDFRLMQGSACIDAGDNSYVSGEFDCLGRARLQNGTVDVGACEGSYVSSNSTTWTVVFELDSNGVCESEEMLVQRVVDGNAAVTPIVSTVADWFFCGWSADYSLITNDLTVTASYRRGTPPDGLYVKVVEGLEWTYLISDGEASLGGGGSSTVAVTTDDERLVLPGELDYCPVVGINAYAFSRCDGMLDVSLPPTIRSIGNGAFFYCRNLSAVVLPDGIVSIGSYAFEYCGTLSEITIPATVTNIGYGAFSYCDSLRTIYVSAGDEVRIQNLMLNSGFDISKINIIDPLVSHLVSFDLAGHGNHTGGGALVQVVSKGCAAEAPTFSVDVGWEFAGWDHDFDCVTNNLNVTAVYVRKGLPDGQYAVTTNGVTWAFVVKDGRATLGGGKTSSPTVPSSVVGSLEIPSIISNTPVVAVSNYAFYNCSRLTSITIPSSVTNIGSSAFSGCSGLTSVTIPSCVTRLSSTFPSSYRQISSVVLLDGRTTIQNSMFSGCYGLTSVAIPVGVTAIGSSAFSDCRGLSSVIIPDGTTSLGLHAFSGCSQLTTISIPASVSTIGTRVFEGCQSLQSIDVSSQNRSYKSISGLLCNKSGTTLISVPGGARSVSIPSGVTSIGEDAFSKCSNLTSVEIPSSVTSIGYLAFYACSSLTEIVIPSGVTSIDGAAFYACTALTNIAVDVSNGTFASADGVLYDKALTKLILCPQGKTSVLIHSGVTDICDSAFQDCNVLTSVEIPSSVTNIFNSAFSGCVGLTAIGVDEFNPSYASVDGVLYNKDMTMLLYCPGGKAALEIPPSVVAASPYAFDSYGLPPHALSSVKLPASLLPMEELFEFYALESVTNIVVCEGATNICDYAFADCYSLQSVSIPEGVTTIGDFAFAYCPMLTSVLIPASAMNIGESAFYYCNSMTDVEVADSNAFYASVDGVLYDKGVAMLIYCPAGKSSVTVPSSVTSVNPSAFQDCRQLRTIYVDCGDVSRVEDLLVRAGLNTSSLTFVELWDESLIISPDRLPDGAVGQTYSAMLTADGGVLPYVWHVRTTQKANGAGYSECRAASTFVSTGTAKGWQSDDQCWSCALPFAFPFYGKTHTTAYIGSNGTLAFDGSFSGYQESMEELKNHAMIAVMWDDLKTIGGDVYVASSSDAVTVRWSGTNYSGGGAVNFAVTLYVDGHIRLAYGSGNANGGLVGISAGNGENYYVCECSQTGSLANAQDVILTPVSGDMHYGLPQGLTLSEDGALTGTPTETASNVIDVVVMDAQEQQNHKEVILVVKVPTVEVTFDIGEHGRRIGGGALVQEVRMDDAAIAPELDADDGWVFSGWDASFEHVRSNLLVQAIWRRTVDLYVDAITGSDVNDGLSRSNAFATIQRALDCAVSDQKIIVGDGVYPPIYMPSNKCLKLVSANGPSRTVIDGGNTNRCATLDFGGADTGTVLQGFTLRNGYAETGGACSYGRIEACVLTNNVAEYGGGTYLTFADRCVFLCNTAMRSGGGAYKGTIRSSLLYENVGMYGGASYSANLYNCTVVRNHEIGVYVYPSEGEQKNCIVWGNYDGNYNGGWGFAYSCTQPIPSGTGNIATDPLFVDPEKGDFRLLEWSPCIDAGYEGYVSTSFDLAGGARVSGATVDIGAYEGGVSVPPPVSHNVWASDGKTEGIELSWDRERFATSYKILRKIVDGGEYVELTETQDNSFIDYNVEQGVIYEYCIKCVNPSGACDCGDSDTGYRNPPLSLESFVLPDGSEMVPYSARICTTYTNMSYALVPFSVPAGLEITADGELRGIPLTAGSYDVKIGVVEPSGAHVYCVLSLTIHANPNLRPELSFALPQQAELQVCSGLKKWFVVMAHDPECATVTYRWYVDDVLVSTESSGEYCLDTGNLAIGEHNVSCDISDGLWEHAVVQTWTLTIVQPICVTPETDFSALAGQVGHSDCIVFAPGEYEFSDMEEMLMFGGRLRLESECGPNKTIMNLNSSVETSKCAPHP